VGELPFVKRIQGETLFGHGATDGYHPVPKKRIVCRQYGDGIALADEGLRRQWSSQFPNRGANNRQREFMINQIGIKLKPEVLPLSNIPAYYNPYLLTNRAWP